MNKTKLTKEQQAAIKALNELALQIETIPHPARSRAAKRAGLARVRAARPGRMTSRSAWRWMALPTGAVAMLAILMVFASSSLPGAKLYAMKRTGENVRDAFTFSASGKAKNCSLYMKVRSDELVALSKQNTAPSARTITSLLDDIVTEANEFEEYANQTKGETQKNLHTLRKDDAATVADQLSSIKGQSPDEKTAQTIQDTIDTLQKIAKS